MKIIRNYYLDKALKNHRSELNYSGWKSIKRIIVLFDEEQENQGVYLSRLEHISKIGPEVVHLVHSQTKKPKEEVTSNMYYKGDVSYFGRPKKAIFGMLQEAEVLVDWTNKEQSPNDFLSAVSSAGFKIGIDRSLPCFHFVVKGKESSAEDVVKEIKNYLKLINNDD